MNDKKWIRPKDKLPDDWAMVLVTIAIPDRSKKVRSGHFYDGVFWLDNGDYWDLNDKEVTAWMLQPEPYNGEK